MSKLSAKVVEIGGAKTSSKKEARILITPPNFEYATVSIEGTAPYLSNAMSGRKIDNMREGQLQGTTNRGMKKKRPPKDFEQEFLGSMHLSLDGWYGIPAGSFRKAMISACTTVGFPMTRAKQYLFVEADGIDAQTAEGLVRINGPKPVMDERIGKLATGVADILVRGRFDKWSCDLRIKWDADALTATDIMNLLARAGVHVGVGAGRPGSSNSAGIGMGTFEVKGLDLVVDKRKA